MDMTTYFNAYADFCSQQVDKINSNIARRIDEPTLIKFCMAGPSVENKYIYDLRVQERIVFPNNDIKLGASKRYALSYDKFDPDADLVNCVDETMH